jgi:hypothetical protein
MSVKPVNEAGNNPWIKTAVIATASLAVITFVVCSLLAILVSYQILTSLPAQFTVMNLLIAGAVGGVFFALVSLAIKYCCGKAKQGGGGQGNNTGPIIPGNNTGPITPGNNQPGGKGGNGGNTPLDPNGGGGNTGALGRSKSDDNLVIKGKGLRRDPLGV